MDSDAFLKTTALEQACRDAGLTVGKQRLVIIQVLDAASDHPTADEIHRRARQIDPGISIGTVYRTLAIFERHGLVFSFDFGDRKARYEDASRGPHDHIIDAESGEIANFKDENLERALRETVRRMGYQLRDYRLDLLCSPIESPRWGKTLARRVTTRFE